MRTRLSDSASAPFQITLFTRVIGDGVFFNSAGGVSCLVSGKEKGYHLMNAFNNFLFVDDFKKGGTPMRAAGVLRSLPQAYKVIKEMQLTDEAWESEYRQAARVAIKRVIEGAMRDRSSRHVEEIADPGEADRRNGRFSRHLLTEIGDIALEVPRTRRTSAVEVVRASRTSCQGR